jgi:hypothetical protein
VRVCICLILSIYRLISNFCPYRKATTARGFSLVKKEALSKGPGLDATVDLAHDVVVDGVEKGDDDVLAAHLQLLLPSLT